MTEQAKRRRRRPSVGLLRAAVYFIFFVLITAFSSVLLVQYLRYLEVPERDDPKPVIRIKTGQQSKPSRTVQNRQIIVVPNPTRLKANAIWNALSNRNLPEFTELLQNAQPVHLYAYPQHNHPSTRRQVHIYTRILHLRCPDSLEILLNSGLVDVNAHTLLHKFIQHFALIPSPIQTQFYDSLLQHGVDIEFSNQDGLTPLAIAARDGNLIALNYLIEHGVVINRPFPKSDSILHFLIDNFIQDVCSINEKYQKVIETLIKAGANAFYRGKDGCSAFHHAILLQFNPKVYKIFINTIPDQFDPGNYLEALVNYPISPETVENPSEHSLYGYMPLHLAVHRRNPDMAVLFLEHGADLQGKDNSDLTPFDHAVIIRNEELKQILSSING